MTNLKTYLAEHGITQARFAEIVGLNQSTVSRLCGPRPPITPETARRIEEATGGAVPALSWPQFAVLAGREPVKGAA